MDMSVFVHDLMEAESMIGSGDEFISNLVLPPDVTILTITSVPADSDQTNVRPMSHQDSPRVRGILIALACIVSLVIGFLVCKFCCNSEKVEHQITSTEPLKGEKITAVTPTFYPRVSDSRKRMLNRKRSDSYIMNSAWKPDKSNQVDATTLELGTEE